MDVKHDFSIIIYREYIGKTLFLAYLVYKSSNILQRISGQTRSLIKSLQLNNQLFYTFQIGFHQHPPSHWRHLDF